MEPLMPFNYVIITPEDTSMSEGCMSASLPRSIAISPSDRHFPELLELPPKHCPGNQACYKIGNRHTYPDSQLSVELWKNQQTRYQDKNLAGDRQKYRLARHADTLEEVGSHHLKPTIGKNITTIRSPLAEMRTSSSCVVKIETASRGINIPIRKPVVVTMVAA